MILTQHGLIRFKGSSLECIGSHDNGLQDGQYAVVGGTGEFAGANGVVNVKFIERSTVTATGVLRELNIRVLCPCPSLVSACPRILLIFVYPAHNTSLTQV